MAWLAGEIFTEVMSRFRREMHLHVNWTFTKCISVFLNRSVKPCVKTLRYIKVLQLVRGGRLKGQVVLHVLHSTETSLWVSNSESLPAEFGIRRLSDRDFRSIYWRVHRAKDVQCPSCQNELPGRARLEAETGKLYAGSQQGVCAQRAVLRAASHLPGPREQRAQISPCRDVPG